MEEWDPIVQEVCFYIAIVFVLLYYLSPAVMLYLFRATNLLKWKELPIAQTFGAIFNCLYWIITGSQSTGVDKADTIIYNGIGLGLSILSAIMIWYAGGGIKNRFFILFMGFNVTFQIGWEISKVDRGKESDGKDGLISSIIASIFNVLMYLFCMQNFFTARKTHNYRKLPIASIVTGIGSTFFWMIYGFSKVDLYIIIPNAIGCVILSAFLGVWIWFYNTHTLSDKDSLSNTNKSNVEIPSSSENSRLIDQLID